MKRPRKILLCEKDHMVDASSVIILIREYEEYIDWLEREGKPDHISWHSVERIQELEAQMGKAGETIDELKHQGDLGADYVAGLEKRVGELETLHYKGVAPIDEKGYHNWPEPKPHTCGECGKAWRSDKFKKGVMCYDFPGAVRTDRNNECPACEKFELREGLC